MILSVVVVFQVSYQKNYRPMAMLSVSTKFKRRAYLIHITDHTVNPITATEYPHARTLLHTPPKVLLYYNPYTFTISHWYSTNPPPSGITAYEDPSLTVQAMHGSIVPG